MDDEYSETNNNLLIVITVAMIQKWQASSYNGLKLLLGSINNKLDPFPSSSVGSIKVGTLGDIAIL
jgi:hypothetical protein